MPATNYTVASAAQLRGDWQVPHISKRRNKAFPPRPLDPEHTTSRRLRHETRKISDEVKKEFVCEDAQQLPSRATPAKAEDIYFSPLEITPGTVILSNPRTSSGIPSHDSTVLSPSEWSLTLTAFPMPPSQETLESTIAVPNADSSKITVTPKELSGLVEALANCSLVRCSLHEDYASLLCDTSSNPASPNCVTRSLYSLPNQQFLSDGPQDIAPQLELTSEALDAVTMIDTTCSRQEMLMSSYKPDLIAQTAGNSAIAINIPLESKRAATLHIKGGISAQEPITISLQVVITGLNCTTGDPMSYISVEHDVTENFAKAAVAELAQHAEVSCNEIRVSDTRNGQSNVAQTSTVPNWANWMTFADELQVIGETNDLLDALLTYLHTLTAETCTMQTLSLMSQVSRLICASTDCIVVKLTPPADRRRWQGNVVQLSRSMTTKLADMDASADGSPVTNRASRSFLRQVCQLVVGHRDRTEEYTLTDTKELIHTFWCVPLYHADEDFPLTWAVFVLAAFTRR